MTEKYLYEFAMNRLPEKYDKSTGTVMSDIIAATCKLIVKSLEETDKILENMIYDTADEEWKERIAKDRCNLARKQATYASGICKVKGEPGATVNIGDKVATDTIVFTVTSGVVLNGDGLGEIEVQCDTAGSVGNVPEGAINSFPITLSGVFEVANEQAFSNGYDKENIEDFDERYYAKRNNPGTSGNKHHYKTWALEVSGIGDCKVFPRMPSRGNVTIVIIDSNKLPTSNDLVIACKSHIDDVKPISADVIVAAAIGVEINVSVSLVTDGAKDYTEDVKTALIKYLADVAFKQNYVSYAQIGDRILAIDGVRDYSNLNINGGITNISIPDTSVAIAGGVSLV